MAKTAVEFPIGEMRYIDPKLILVKDNLRYGLKKSRLESLKDKILEDGQVNDALDVEVLSEPEDGKKLLLTAGNYRLAAVLELNEKKGADLKVPVVFREQRSRMDRLNRQLSENVDRTDLSPMDLAAAIKTFYDAGMSRAELMEKFKRPGPGGTQRPSSNSFLNTMMSFLDFPKKLQNKIHIGELGVGGAMELRKEWEKAIDKGLNPEEVANEIFAAAETELMKAVAKDEADDANLRAKEAKLAEEEAKRKAAQEALVKAEAEVEAAKASLEVSKKVALEAYTATKDSTILKDAELKKKAYETFKAAEANVAAATKEVETKAKAAEKLVMASKSAAEKEKERAEKLKALREQNSSKPSVGKGDITKAAAKVAGSKDLRLSAPEMRRIAEDLAIPGGDDPIPSIGKALVECFNGNMRDGEGNPSSNKLVNAIKEILGMVVEVKKPKRKAVAA